MKRIHVCQLRTLQNVVHKLCPIFQNFPLTRSSHTTTRMKTPPPRCAFCSTRTCRDAWVQELWHLVINHQEAQNNTPYSVVHLNPMQFTTPTGHTVRVCFPQGVFRPSASSEADGGLLRDSWYAARKSFRLNASEMPSVARANFFRKPEDVAVDRATGANPKAWPPTPRECSFEVSPGILLGQRIAAAHMQRGNDFENAAKDAFCEESGHALVPLPDKLLYSSPDVFGGTLSATPDGITFCSGVLETKVPVKAAQSKLKMYADQIQANLAVLGMDRAWLYQYQMLPLRTMSTDVPRDAEWCVGMQPHVDEFQRLVALYVALLHESVLTLRK